MSELVFGEDAVADAANNSRSYFVLVQTVVVGDYKSSHHTSIRCMYQVQVTKVFK